MKKQWKEKFHEFWRDEAGISTLEIIMIIAIVVVIAYAFRKWIVKWVNIIFDSTDKEIGKYNNEVPNNINSPTSTP